MKIFKDKIIRTRIYIALLLLGAVALCLPYDFSKDGNRGKYAELIKEETPYEIVDIFDGDTFVVDVEGHEVTVRLIGIDTPEVVDPRKPVQCYGPEASAKAKELLTGARVYLEKEKTKGDYDIYGRVLAYAYLSDKKFYNQYMIEEGYAKEYTFNKEKYKYQTEFKEAQKGAQEKKRGLWGSCVTSP